jgi:poly(hydroxyalkanoate) granule-associated protein
MLDAVHQIWLAGLGAASRARQSGPQLFQDLVSEGARVHAETRGAAEKALRGVVGDMQQRINAGVGQVRGQAEDTLANLEKIFETRVHRALTRIGVPSAEDIEALSKRVEGLNANIDRLARARKAPAHPRKHAGRKAAGAHAAAS